MGLLLGAVVPALAVPEARAQEAPSPQPLPPPTWPYQFPVRPYPGNPRHRNQAMMVAGIVVTGLGLVSTVVSSGLLVPRAQGMASICPGCDSVGAVLLPLSAIVPPAIGIPLWVAGARSPGSWSVSVVPAITPTSRAAAFQWSF